MIAPRQCLSPRALAAAPNRLNRTGSILLAVLALITLMSFVILAFMEEATAKIKYYGLFYNRDDLRAEAYSYMETALAVIDEIHEIDSALYAPIQGWQNPLQYSQIEIPKDLKVRIRVVDEAAKLSLYDATPEVLIALFTEMGISFDDVQVLTDSILDWIDTDDLTRLNGAEREYYENQETDYLPANGKFQSWEELRLIRGFDEIFFDEDRKPTPYFSRMTSALSIYHNTPVNLNSANGFVLGVVARVEGYPTDMMNDYLNGVDGERGTEDDRLINSTAHAYYPNLSRNRSKLTGIQTDILKVEVSVTHGEANFLLTAIVKWVGSNPGANAVYGSSRQTSRRGQTAAPEDPADKLGYPFEIVRITENFKI